MRKNAVELIKIILSKSVLLLKRSNDFLKIFLESFG